MKQDAPTTALNDLSLPDDPILLKRMIEELLTQLRDQKNELAGPLFRGKSNKPYSKNAIRCRFRRLRDKLPQLGHFISYTFRATYATNALENGG